MRIQVYILLLLLPLICYAQKEDRIWVFGYNAGINFSDTANIVNFNSRCTNFKTTASIADPAGNLLFYIGCDFLADTCVLFDRFHLKIPGTDSISAYRGFTNNSAIVSFPEDSVYYLFHIGDKVGACPLSYCLVVYFTKLKLHSTGQFEVLEKNIAVSNELAFEKLTVVKHANGNDWWLVVPMLKEPNSYCTNKVLSFLVTKDTI